MHPQTESSATIKRGTAATLVCLLAAGAAGVSIGDPRWGFLGAALLLFGVGWVCYLFQYDHGTDEIERCYNPPEAVPVRRRVTTRSFVLTPQVEPESISQ